MNLSPALILSALRQTYEDPKGVARWVISRQVPAGVALMALAAIAGVTTILGFVPILIFGADAPPGLETLVANPLLIALVQFGVPCLSAVLMVWVGRIFGGQGSLAQGLALTAWLQGMLMLLQVVQLLLLFLVPLLCIPFALFTALSAIFFMTHFTMVLNGFTNAVLTVVGMAVTAFLVLIAVSVLLIPFFPVPNV